MTSPGTGQSRDHEREHRADAATVDTSTVDTSTVDTSTVSTRTDSTAAMPEVEPLLRALALRVIEVLAGARELEQLARWVTDDVYAHLGVRASIAARARAVTRVVAERPRLWIDHVTTWPTETGGFNAVMLVFDKRRAHVISMQLERVGQRWRATVIVVM
ncbi:Rv3235 family protein [Cryobacterium sp. PH29-G1]|uniref:Rv3235 family protein n=1 Tax=Cryobacterium sp. PH29-G1 TaxID=3046211 RepID=UPI0024B88DE7|nr:Rv3235 family protein [Cryobacterium sp. PH29-G1]MDJ0349871.1 Rv3235 family protein [Cryobacterium sp. PH29-G1]